MIRDYRRKIIEERLRMIITKKKMMANITHDEMRKK